MKRNTLLVGMACICAVLSVCLLSGVAQNKAAKPARGNFIPSPVFSPPYPPLPHHFNDSHVIQVLCQAPKGAVKRALPAPLEQVGDDERFVVLMGWSPDCEGFNVHEIAINVPVKWKGSVGWTTLIEYIDSDMGLITGREVWGWPKKMSDIVWKQTAAGWTVDCNKQKDQGSIPLIKVAYTIAKSAPAVEWPAMGPTYLVKRIPNASPSVPPLTQLVCVGCNLPGGGVPGMAPSAKTTETKGIATVKFFDGPHDPLTFFGPAKVLAAKMSITKGAMTDGLGLGEVIFEWKE